jgi:hypothetical protein
MSIYKLFEHKAKDYSYLNLFQVNLSIKDSYISENYNIEDIQNLQTKKIIKSSLTNETINLDKRVALKRIISDSKDILEYGGIKNNITSHGIVEYHRYLNGDDMPLSIHTDDYGATNYTVNTVIFYLSKTVEGGDLEIYKDDKIIEVIDVKPSPDMIKIVIMEGNILHNVSKIKNRGIRECIVVQFKCEREI